MRVQLLPGVSIRVNRQTLPELRGLPSLLSGVLLLRPQAVEGYKVRRVVPVVLDHVPVLSMTGVVMGNRLFGVA